MPSRKVEFAQGQYYHIYNRGVGRQAIFLDDENYVFALQRIKKYANAFDIAIVAYLDIVTFAETLHRIGKGTDFSLTIRSILNPL